jgi:hypothetical protein
MQTVKITLADNGVIKTVFDDNINSGGESFESTTVYEFENQATKIKFINELCLDIGLSFGNSRNKQQIKIIEEWGVDYIPSDSAKKEKIKNLQDALKILVGIT